MSRRCFLMEGKKDNILCFNMTASIHDNYDNFDINKPTMRSTYIIEILDVTSLPVPRHDDVHGTSR